MSQIFIFILGLGVGALAVFLLYPKIPKDKDFGERPAAKETELDIVKRQAKEKEENTAKVREFFKQKEQAVNDDIQKLLGVSDASATRYLDELEKDGFIRQVGDTGSGVYYKRVK